MQKYFVTIMLAVVMTLTAAAHTTARQAFTEAPGNVFMLLDRDTRLDMLDYYEAGSEVSVANQLYGTSRITSLTDDMITIEMTPASVYQLIILPGASDQQDVIALIITLASPAHDSRVTFYSAADWTEIPNSKIMAEPDLKAWLTPEGRKNQAIVESMVPFILASYSYAPATKTLTLTNELGSFLSEDVYSMVKPYLLPTLTYQWTGRKMSPAK